MNRLKQFITEIHRRSLWQVLLIYVGGAWICYEIIDTITDRLALPEWLPRVWNEWKDIGGGARDGQGSVKVSLR
jgi:hypothetical protein